MLKHNFMKKKVINLADGSGGKEMGELISFVRKQIPFVGKWKNTGDDSAILKIGGIRKKNSLIAYGLIWFFINLVIESTVIALELKFEHRLYLPSIGFYLSLVLIVAAIFKYFIKVKDEELVRASIICFSLILF